MRAARRSLVVPALALGARWWPGVMVLLAEGPHTSVADCTAGPTCVTVRLDPERPAELRGASPSA